MADARIEYVHVLDRETKQSIHVVECKGARAEHVARGMSINLDHDQYELCITLCGHPMANTFRCLTCTAQGVR